MSTFTEINTIETGVALKTMSSNVVVETLSHLSRIELMCSTLLHIVFLRNINNFLIVIPQIGSGKWILRPPRNQFAS